MADTLVVRIGAKVVGRFPITKKDTVLGRAGDIVLDSGRASTRHAVVRAVGFRRYVIIDLGSLNGTRVNDEPLAPNIERPLEHGDTIQIAQFIIRAVLSLSSGERPSVPHGAGGETELTEVDRDTSEGRPAFAEEVSRVGRGAVLPPPTPAAARGDGDASTYNVPPPHSPVHVPVIVTGQAGTDEETYRPPVGAPVGAPQGLVLEPAAKAPPPSAKAPPPAAKAPPSGGSVEETLNVPPPAAIARAVLPPSLEDTLSVAPPAGPRPAVPARLPPALLGLLEVPPPAPGHPAAPGKGKARDPRGDTWPVPPPSAAAPKPPAEVPGAAAAAAGDAPPPAKPASEGAVEKPAGAKGRAEKPASPAAEKAGAAAPVTSAKGPAAAPSAEVTVGAAGPVRPRTTKTIQARLDHTYIDRIHPIRRHLRTAWVGALVASILWIATASAIGRRTVFSSGPLSASHAMLENDCASCHARSFSAIPDAACLTCHDGLLTPAQLALRKHVAAAPTAAPAPTAGAAPAATTAGAAPTATTAGAALAAASAPGAAASHASFDADSRFPTHHANQIDTGACVSCHVEHDDRRRLVDGVVDGHCTSCHADLQATGAFTIAGTASRAIASLERGHPEFAPVAAASGTAWAQVGSAPEGNSAALAASGHDEARIHLNHSVHMAPTLAGMDGEGRRAWIAAKGRPRMVCADCHEPDASRRYMRPIRFESHCVSCHGLSVTLGPLVEKDERLSRTAVVPHGLAFSDVRAMLAGQGFEQDVRAFYERVIEANPDLLAAPAPGGAAPGGTRPGPPVPGGRPLPPGARQPIAAAAAGATTPAAWVAAKVAGFTSAVMKSERGVKVPTRLGGTRDLERTLWLQCLKCHYPRGAGFALDLAPLLEELARDPSTKVAESVRGEAERRAGVAYAAAVLDATGGGAFPEALPAYPRAVPPAPAISPPRIPERWMPVAVFDHEAHRAIGCLECHAKAASGSETLDVMLPSLESCKSCHKAGGAGTRCVECHEYHDRAGQRDFDGGLRIEALRARGDR